MVSKLILGTVQMGMRYGVNNSIGQPTELESHRILSGAYKSGIDMLDSAEAYGIAHKVIGSFHEQNPSTTFKIVTKIQGKVSGFSFRESVLRYIKDLNVESLEAIMFHSFAVYHNFKSEIGDLLSLKEDRVVNSIGVSIYTNQEFVEVTKDKQVDLIQLPFNLLDNFSIRGNYLLEAKENGKIVHTRSAFLQGLFFKNFDDLNAIALALRPQLLALKSIAVRENLSVADLALSYCLYQNTIDRVIIGVESLDQLTNNLQSAKVRLTPQVIREIEQIETFDLNLLNPSLWA